ncbi:MAG: LPS export ABC transporter permease LptF [Gammaproteobacteria bacterium]|nr:MAG: LPS export ABC transporter permease LptF [Gammaproteobacteria bacterium]
MIIDRYIFKEIAFTQAAAFIVLLILLISQRFAHYLGEAVSGGLPADILLVLLGLKALSLLSLLLPATLLLGILLAMGRMHRDRETIALSACGIHPAQMLRPMGALGLLIALCTGLFSFYLAPWAAQKGQLLKQRAEQLADLNAIAAGRFVELQRGWGVFYAERLSEDRKRLYHIFIQSRRQGELEIHAAREAQLRVDKESGDRLLILYEGYRYQGIPGRKDFQILRYSKQVIRFRRQNGALSFTRLEAKPVSQLLASREIQDRAEFQWRLSLPLSALLLALLGWTLSPHGGEGRWFNLLGGLVIYFIYQNLLGVARTWMEQGTTPPAWGLWWVHGALMLSIAALYAWRRR